jgi:hypothetical protein
VKNIIAYPVVAMLAFISCALGQDLGTATFVGTVTGSRRATVANAAVTVSPNTTADVSSPQTLGKFASRHRTIFLKLVYPTANFQGVLRIEVLRNGAALRQYRK